MGSDPPCDFGLLAVVFLSPRGDATVACDPGVPTVTEQNRTLKGRSWDRLASQDLSPSVSQGTIWRYVAVDGRLGYA